MSHFAVLVITETEPTETMLRATLQPWHEFECTGIDDKYIVDTDMTAEALDGYATSTTRCLRDSMGTLHDPWSDRFYREPTAEEIETIGPFAGSGCGHGISWKSKDWDDGKGHRAKIHFTPAQYEEVEVPASQTETIGEWIERQYGWNNHATGDTKYGYYILNADGSLKLAVDRTNPNKKWDWWVVGGRCSNRFIHKDGTPNLNEIRMGDVDYPAMLAKAQSQRGKWWDDEHEKFIGRAKVERFTGAFEDAMSRYFEILDAANEAHGKDYTARREALQNNAEFQKYTALCGDAVSYFGLSLTPKDFRRADYIAQAVPLSSFAVVHDGQWYQRGEMGWWGSVSDEEDSATWQAKFDALLADLPADSYLTIVDCHI